MIFAAGFGRRMGALTQSTPKPLLRIGDETLLDHAISKARAAGCPLIGVNTHYLAAQIAAHLQKHHPDVIVSHEPNIIRDTGGGLAQALPMMGAPGVVMTMNADIFWGAANPLQALLSGWNPAQMDALLLAGESTKLGRSSADFTMAEDGQLARAGGGSAGYTYLSAQIMATPRVLAQSRDVFSLNVVWDEMGASARLFGLPYDGPWVDVGTRSQFEAACASIKDAPV